MSPDIRILQLQNAKRALTRVVERARQSHTVSHDELSYAMRADVDIDIKRLRGISPEELATITNLKLVMRAGLSLVTKLLQDEEIKRFDKKIYERLKDDEHLLDEWLGRDREPVPYASDGYEIVFRSPGSLLSLVQQIKPDR